MAILSLIAKLFGADVAAPPDAKKLDGTTEATLARSLSALPPDEHGWITWIARGGQSNAKLLIEGLRKAGLPE